MGVEWHVFRRWLKGEKRITFSAWSTGNLVVSPMWLWCHYLTGMLYVCGKRQQCLSSSSFNKHALMLDIQFRTGRMNCFLRFFFFSTSFRRQIKTFNADIESSRWSNELQRQSFSRLIWPVRQFGKKGKQKINESYLTMTHTCSIQLWRYYIVIERKPDANREQ